VELKNSGKVASVRVFNNRN